MRAKQTLKKGRKTIKGSQTDRNIRRQKKTTPPNKITEKK